MKGGWIIAVDCLRHLGLLSLLGTEDETRSLLLRRCKSPGTRHVSAGRRKFRLAEASFGWSTFVPLTEAGAIEPNQPPVA